MLESWDVDYTSCSYQEMINKILLINNWLLTTTNCHMNAVLSFSIDKYVTYTLFLV